MLRNLLAWCARSGPINLRISVLSLELAAGAIWPIVLWLRWKMRQNSEDKDKPPKDGLQLTIDTVSDLSFTTSESFSDFGTNSHRLAVISVSESPSSTSTVEPTVKHHEDAEDAMSRLRISPNDNTETGRKKKDLKDGRRTLPDVDSRVRQSSHLTDVPDPIEQFRYDLTSVRQRWTRWRSDLSHL